MIAKRWTTQVLRGDETEGLTVVAYWKHFVTAGWLLILAKNVFKMKLFEISRWAKYNDLLWLVKSIMWKYLCTIHVSDS